MTQQFPAGLIDDNQELFANGTEVACLDHGSVISFENFDGELLDNLEAELMMNQVKLSAIKIMAGPDRLAMIRQYTYCNHGGFDNTPDIIAGKLQAPEYWPCPNRGKCKWEGIACDSLVTDLGYVMTKREIQVMVLTAQGKLNKEISDMLFIEKSTVDTHYKNIRRKTGIDRKPELAVYVTLKNLVS